ncbi:helix-turn-helix domain-containing protein [Dongia soli]|uniref:Helix-turn-helix transcriptional regulator n=1 Tax=Dongia soli TaxID=600628 RepID=A0ABU5EDT7_9PROT|nr:helix-turn-helix transcriptional regulator [Dongia soli]MDY0884491.1 helix-turn-helix transcriptional regulator [Dongia soli]
MPRPPKTTHLRHFSAETFGTFIKTVREAQGMRLAAVAREADVNRQGLHKLEQGQHLPSIRTIEAVCHQMGLDPLAAIEKRFSGIPGTTSAKRHVLEGRLAELSDDDLALVIDFIDLLLARAKPAKGKRKNGSQ